MLDDAAFVEQLETVRAAWQSCRRHLFQNTISSRPRSVVFAEMDAAADVVVEAIARLAAVATTKEQQTMVAEIDERFGGAVRDEADSRRRNPAWLSRLSPLDGGSVETPG
jgi:hypothetical protein